MPGETTTDSPALRFLDILWHGMPGGSWSRINHSMWAGLKLAIEAKLAFDAGDFYRIASRYRWTYWCSSDGGEHYYGTACTTPNPSAYRALESYWSRRPLMYDGKRLYVGADLEWEGHRCHVSSMARDGSCFVAIVPGAYDPETERQASHPSRIFRITADELRASEKAKRAAKAAARPPVPRHPIDGTPLRDPYDRGYWSRETGDTGVDLLDLGHDPRGFEAGKRERAVEADE